MIRDPLGKAEPIVLAVVLAAAGLSITIGRAWQAFGHAIDRAVTWGLRP